MSVMLSEGASANSFYGRVAHFAAVTNPLNCLASSVELDAAADVVRRGSGDDSAARTLYESAYHPDTGERIPLIGRMCFQAPGCALLAAAMLSCHASLPLTLGLQWANQSFMAVCNYSNRNAKSDTDDAGVLRAYAGATLGSMGTAWGLKRCLPRTWSVLVPAAAISVASLVNVPCMRSAELLGGLVVEDGAGVPLEARSRAAACYAIGAVTCSRILNGCADLVIAPAIVGALGARYAWAKSKRPLVTVPLYATLCFATLSVSTPITTALAPQRASLPAAWLGSPALCAEIDERRSGARVFFNKGL